MEKKQEGINSGHRFMTSDGHLLPSIMLLTLVMM